MKLEYKVWWFDDQPQYIKSSVDGIRDRLSRKGFKLNVMPVDRIGDLGALLAGLEKKEKPDLILMDWHLNDGKDGASVAKAIRRRFQYVEIVFYSAATSKELRKAIYDQEIDGVYCAHRDNLVTEAMGVVETTLKKVLDLNHMRGIVMAYVSDLDRRMLDCIKECHCLLDEEGRKLLIEKIKGNVRSLNESELKKIEALIPDNEFEELVNLFSFGTTVRFKTLKKILYDEKAILSHVLEKLNQYEVEVIRPRNELAHVCEKQDKGKVVLEGKGVVYDESRLSDLRIELLAHLDNLDDILKSLKAGSLIPKIN